jgi:hypothetical protein
VRDSNGFARPWHGASGIQRPVVASSAAQATGCITLYAMCLGVGKEKAVRPLRSSLDFSKGATQTGWQLDGSAGSAQIPDTNASAQLLGKRGKNVSEFFQLIAKTAFPEVDHASQFR